MNQFEKELTKPMNIQEVMEELRDIRENINFMVTQALKRQKESGKEVDPESFESELMRGLFGSYTLVNMLILRIEDVGVENK